MIRFFAKGQLSIGTVGLAITVLVLVAIVVGLLTGFIGDFSSKTDAATADDCPGRVTDGQCTGVSAYHIPVQGFFDDVDPGEICCEHKCTLIAGVCGEQSGCSTSEIGGPSFCDPSGSSPSDPNICCSNT